TAVAFSRHGVHEGQQFILRLLWAEDGQTPGEIARRLGLATPTVTRAATRMEAGGPLGPGPPPGGRRGGRAGAPPRGGGAAPPRPPPPPGGPAGVAAPPPPGGGPAGGAPARETRTTPP